MTIKGQWFRTTEQLGTSGKVCKGTRGLKIHQGRMGCLRHGNLMRRRRGRVGCPTIAPRISRHATKESAFPQIPTMNQTTSNIKRGKPAWKQVSKFGPLRERKRGKSEYGGQQQQGDREIDQVLESVLAGDICRKIKAMSTIIWNMGVERFGTEQRQTKGPQHAGENKPSREIAKLRADLRRLRKIFRQALEDEKPAIKEMRDNVRERIKNLRQAECQ